MIIYSNKYEVLLEKVLDESSRIDVGKYFFNHLTEDKEQKFYYEWYGEIDGTPSLKRGQFATKFI